MARGSHYLLQQTKPICYVCKREDDELISGMDFMTMQVRFVIRCHGQEERYSVESDFIRDHWHEMKMSQVFMQKDEVKQIGEAKHLEDLK